MAARKFRIKKKQQQSLVFFDVIFGVYTHVDNRETELELVTENKRQEFCTEKKMKIQSGCTGSPSSKYEHRQISPRRCHMNNHVTSYACLIKEPLDALSAAIWPCSRRKKIPIRSFLCRQNHFSQLIRHQSNNYCYFLLG